MYFLQSNSFLYNFAPFPSPFIAIAVSHDRINFGILPRTTNIRSALNFALENVLKSLTGVLTSQE